MQFVINTQKGQELLDVTKQVVKALGESGVKEGVCTVYTPHSSAGILINENWDEKICNDIVNVLERLIPKDAGYWHDEVDGNGHSHVKASIIGPSESIPVSGGELKLGRWQGITFAEFDGPRRRTVMVKVVGK